MARTAVEILVYDFGDEGRDGICDNCFFSITRVAL